MQQDGKITLISLGSNSTSGHDAALKSVLRARQLLHDKLGDVAWRASRMFATPAFPAGIGPDFVNGAVSLRTRLDAAQVLDILHDIEAAEGRIRTIRWGQRSLDLDLLAQGDDVLPDRATQTVWRALAPQDQRDQWPDQLILPHPRMQDRAFVLVPLAQVAPDWVHPLLNLSVTAMRDRLPAPELDRIVALAD